LQLLREAFRLPQAEELLDDGFSSLINITSSAVRGNNQLLSNESEHWNKFEWDLE
jgi:hypothetical protein